jgi:hypothetical protein
MAHINYHEWEVNILFITGWPVRAWCLSMANAGRVKAECNAAPHILANVRGSASTKAWIKTADKDTLIGAECHVRRAVLEAFKPARMWGQRSRPT